MHQTYQSVVFRYDFCQISVTISQHRPLPPDFVASLGAFLFRAKSQVLNMLSPCNARLKSLQTSAKFFLFRQSAANSFFHAACNFVATELTSLPAQRQVQGQGRGCVILRQCATPISQHAPVYTFAPLWCIFVALAWRLNCETWPFKNAPRLAKKKKTEKQDQLWNASNFGQQKLRQVVSKVKRAARAFGRGSRMQLPHGCKIYENWFSLKSGKRNLNWTT